MALQKRNDEMVELLSADFQRRYEPNFAWGEILSQWSLLPALRGFWTMAANKVVGAANYVVDASGSGFHLTNNNSAQFNRVGLAPYVYLGGVNQYLSYADDAQLDVSGTEAYILNPGLTMLGWVYHNGAAAAIEPHLNKWDNGAGQSSYALYRSAAGAEVFRVSTDGTAMVTVTSTATIAGMTWSFVAGRFTPGTELAVWINGTKTTNAVGVPASLFNSTSLLRLGVYTGSGYMAGRVSLWALCASALSDTAVWAAYEHSRALFGA